MKKLQMAALGLSALMLVSLGGSAFAGPLGKNVNCREHRQDSRIMRGIYNGSLTRQEAFQLSKGQNKIERYERIARSDGRLSPREFAKLQSMQNRQNVAIYRQKHDNQFRY